MTREGPGSFQVTTGIDQHKEFGVEPICDTLQFAPSIYYAAKSRRPDSRRASRSTQMQLEERRPRKLATDGMDLSCQVSRRYQIPRPRLLEVGDPDGEVSAAWVAKELLRDVFRAQDEAHARRRMIAFYTHCADADIPELNRLARTISRWSDLIFAYHRTGRASNGRTENAHMLAEKIRRNAHGFRNIDNYRRLAHRQARHQMGYSTRRTNTRPPTTVHRVAPLTGLADTVRARFDPRVSATMC